MTSLTAILTTYNRKATTVECLARLERAAEIAGIGLEAILVDDASPDGTAEAVAARFPWVTIEHGGGSLFWNRGMHRAQALAMARPGADFLLWINDDTLLHENALKHLLDTYRRLKERLGQWLIVVGATASDETGELTYGGSVPVSRVRRFAYRKVWNETEPVECEAMNGNLVLLPEAVVRRVGNLDPVFEHACGDIDYGLRARAAGVRLFVAPGFVGNCSQNSKADTFADASLPFSIRWKKLVSRKGVPPRSWLHLTRRHGGWLWPVYFVWPYARLAVSALPRLGKPSLRQSKP